MKAVVLDGVRSVSVKEMPLPQLLQPTDVIVKVTLAGLCGSDLHPFRGDEAGCDYGSTIMGHEYVHTDYYDIILMYLELVCSVSKGVWGDNTKLWFEWQVRQQDLEFPRAYFYERKTNSFKYSVALVSGPYGHCVWPHCQVRGHGVPRGGGC